MKVMIVEDEPLAAEKLESYVREGLGKDLQSLKLLGSVEAAVCFARDNPVDLVFLDLNLHSEDGFDVLARLTAEAFYTIVVSGSPEFAARAFEYGVLDFVVKPYTRERLKKAIARVQSGKGPERQALKRFAVRTEGTVEMMDIDDVQYFFARDHYVTVRLLNGREEVFRRTMEQLESLLPDSFMRTHRSYLVPVEQIERIRLYAGSAYRIELKDGTLLPLSRKKYAELRDRL